MIPRRLVICLTALLLLAGGFGEARADLKWIKPSRHAGRVKVAIDGRKSTYYKATSESPVTLRVQGPIPLRVLHRFYAPSLTSVTPARYSVRILVDGKLVKSDGATVKLVESAAVDGGGFGGRLGKVVAQIPGGEHTVTIAPTGEMSTVLLRVYAGTARKQKTKWMAFEPHTYTESVRLHNRENETIVYRFDQTKPAGVELIGPARLMVGTRIDFGLPDGYTQSYVVKVMKNDKPWKSFALKARSSHTATYPDRPGILPGVERSFELDVPRGTHRLTFHLEGTTAEGAALRLRVPEKVLVPRKVRGAGAGEAQ